jgi:hexosaminidase
MKEFSIIPKPVSIKYTEGVFVSKEPPEIHCQNVPGFADEGYKLIISREKITIESSSPSGSFHGRQAFRQLMLSEFKDGELALPCAEITDYPRFSWRGFMLDCSRHFYTVPFIKNLIDILSMHHINRFHWHLTDDQGWRLPVKEYPLLTEIGSYRKNLRLPDDDYRAVSGGFYTEGQIREIIDFAKERYVEVIPEVDLPGHASAILASYPQLGCTGGPYNVEDRFGIFEDCLCAGNEKIFDLMEKTINALVKLFPSRYVHIGGDEVKYNRWKACPKCKSRQKELGLKKTEELQSWITYRLVTMLNERGKTAIGWDEVLNDSEKYRLPRETVVMSWQGEDGSCGTRGIKASSLEHKVIMSSNTNGCYLDYKHLDTPEEPGQAFNGAASVCLSYSMDPVTPEMKEENSKMILGGQCNLWSELIYADKVAEYMIFPRLCAIAESLWSPKEAKNFEDFSQRLKTHRIRLFNLGINQYLGSLK